jgi:primase-polymerase (primpol)-like protein
MELIMRDFNEKTFVNQHVTSSAHCVPLRYVAEKIRTVVPAGLAAIPSWITWVAGPLKPDGKFDKLPRGRDGSGGRWQMPDQWMGFTEALDAAHSRGHSGVGLVLPAQTPDGQYVVALDYDGVDLPDSGSARVVGADPILTTCAD